MPCNLRGTKSRPNIKQPVFFDPDFPDHDPYRSVSPESPKLEHFDEPKTEIKTEPMDYDENQLEDSKLPLIVEIRSGKDAEFQEPPTKRPNIIRKDDNKPSVTIKKIEIKENLGDQVTLEKIQPNQLNGENDDKRNLSSNSTPALITVKKFASTSNAEGTNSPPPLIQLKTSTDENPTSKDGEITFKKIKLPLAEATLKKLTATDEKTSESHVDSSIETNEVNDDKKETCDSSVKNNDDDNV